VHAADAGQPALVIDPGLPVEARERLAQDRAVLRTWPVPAETQATGHDGRRSCSPHPVVRPGLVVL
jgi:hypothetical protein